MPLITGTDQNDSLTGTEDADVIRGLLGRDTIFGLGGNDQLEGGEGDDLMIGGLGDDLLLGGAGNDTLGEDQGGNDQLQGEDGDDFLYYYGTASAPANARLDGGAGDDLIWCNQFFPDAAVVAILTGGTGHDRIKSYGGAHVTIDAGADSDLIEITDYRTDYGIFLGSGSDVLRIDSNQFHFPEGTDIAIGDFAAGDSGDALSLIPYLARQLDFWSFADNPFAAGYMRLEQRGADAVIQIDRDASRTLYGFEDFLVLHNVSAMALSARNLGGYAADGSATPGATVDGAATADFLNGTSGDDLIRGFGGSDGLFGGAGADRLEGGAGNDTLDGELGDDRVHGGEGDDTLNDMIHGSDELYGEGGNDNLFVDRQFFAAPNATLLLDGGEGNDSIRFMSGIQKHDATLIGGAGNDHINAYLGRNVIIDAGDGADFVDIDVGIGNAVITLGAGADTLALSMYLAPVIGFTVTDFEAGDAGDRMYLLPILQRLVVGWDMTSNPFAENFIRVARQSGDSLLLYEHDGEGTSYNVLGRLAGVDAGQLTAFNFGYDFGLVVILGTAGADSLVGTGAAEELIGQAGNDQLNGGGGADVLAGGAGNDSYFVDDAGDVVIEAAAGGFDIVYAGTSYALAGGLAVEVLATIDNLATGAINLTGNELDNYLVGNAGANTLDGGGGADQLWGREGDDSYFADSNDIVVEYAGHGYDIVYARGSFVLGIGMSVEVLATIDNLATTAINLTGNALDNYLTGNAGANTLDGGGGADQLWGREGDDSYFADGDDVVVEYAGQGYDMIYAHVDYTLPTGLSVEVLATADNLAATALNLTGNELDNYVTGNAGANVIDGGGGVDTLWGRAGDDSYFAEGHDVVIEYAGQGYDIVYARGNYALAAGMAVEVLATADNLASTAIDLTGNELSNFVTGNAGANRIDGGLGADSLQGRGGADSFAFTSALGGGNADTILDFGDGADRILLDDAVFAGLALGALSANAFVAGSAAQDADDRIVYNSATGQLFYDADGNGAGAQVLFATLSGAPPIVAGDFTVI